MNSNDWVCPKWGGGVTDVEKVKLWERSWKFWILVRWENISQIIGKFVCIKNVDLPECRSGNKGRSTQESVLEKWLAKPVTPSNVSVNSIQGSFRTPSTFPFFAPLEIAPRHTTDNISATIPFFFFFFFN